MPWKDWPGHAHPGAACHAVWPVGAVPIVVGVQPEVSEHRTIPLATQCESTRKGHVGVVERLFQNKWPCVMKQSQLYATCPGVLAREGMWCTEG